MHIFSQDFFFLESVTILLKTIFITVGYNLTYIKMSSEVGKIFGIKHFGHVYKLKNNWEEEKRNFKIYAQCSQSYPTLCVPMDCSLPDFSAHGISQARILEWGAISHCRGSSRPRDRTHNSVSLVWAGRFFSTHSTWDVYKIHERG